MAGHRKLLLVVFLGCLVAVGLAGFGDFREVGRHIVLFPPHYLLAAIGLALANYAIRFLRWAYYLKLLGIRAPLSVSLLTFLAGLAMTITPGKVGELLKSYLLRDKAGIPVATSAPVVLMERLTDLVSVAAMGLVGLALLPRPVSLALMGVLVAALAFLYFLTTRRTEWVTNLPLVRRWAEQVREARQGMRMLSGPSALLVAVGLGLAAWVCEGVALWIALEGLGADFSLLLSLPIYGGATLVGAATALPGGLVGTEGAMAAMLHRAGMAPDVAAAGTLLVRLATLWLAVGIGMAALAWLQRLPRFRGATATPAEEESRTPALTSNEGGFDG